MLRGFLALGTKRIDEDLITTYQVVLARYGDEEIRQAAKKCLEEYTSFPKPKEVIDHIPLHTNIPKDYIFNHFHCVRCGEYKFCIKEPPVLGQWTCRQCYTGLSDAEIKNRFVSLMEKIQDMPGPKISKRQKFEPKYQYELRPDAILERKGELAQQYNELKTEDEDIPF